MKQYDKFLIKLNRSQNLTFNEARTLFTAIFKQDVSTPFTKSVLLLLAEKGESIDEIRACVSALESLEKKIPTKLTGLMDTCGTGGDQSQSINVSTLAALVIAGAGGRVAKHGNRSISSKCGSSDLLEALGVKLSAPRGRMIASIKQNGIGYFHAPFYHPVFGKMQPLRKQLGLRTIFNFLGPMVNPFKLTYQLVGVANKQALPIYANILKKKRIQRAWVCHSHQGMDEITHGMNTIADIRKTKSRIIRLEGKTMVNGRSKSGTYKGGTLRNNLRFAKNFLKNKTGGKATELILMNAAAGLFISGKGTSLSSCYMESQKVVSSGKAQKALEGLVATSNKS